MRSEEPNPRLDRIRFQLRADGISLNASNPLRSGIHSRGYLPHVKREGASYFVTFRLADALPTEVLLRFLAEKREKQQHLEHEVTDPLKARSRFRQDTIVGIELDYRRKVERYLDRGAGACWLRRPEIANMVSNALLHCDGEQYVLDDWVVMPNHVHLVLWPMPNSTLSEILKGRKQFTATHANRILARAGEAFWQPESFDHWIRNDAEKARIRRYVRWNPVKAGLCERPEQWPWGSAGLEGSNTNAPDAG
jgi:REP element-mobilizing transposase RayT